MRRRMPLEKKTSPSAIPVNGLSDQTTTVERITVGRFNNSATTRLYSASDASGASLMSISGLRAPGFGEAVFLQLPLVSLLAAEPSLIKTLPSAEVHPAFIELVIAREFAGHQRRMEVGAQHAVFLLEKS